MGIGFIGLGFQPKWERKDIPIMPKGRYEIMRNYMPKVGSLGLDMMFRTCTVQNGGVIRMAGSTLRQLPQETQQETGTSIHVGDASVESDERVICVSSFNVNNL
nr:glutamate--cysteine ligase, chloroplastic [Tanacetum cinerariifolium]